MSVKLIDQLTYCIDGQPLLNNDYSPADGLALNESARDNTLAWKIMSSHNKSDNDKHLMLSFDAMASHDITFVGIIQTARASGLQSFPLPYVLTCCHNSLCAVGGTINEDDHVFGLSAAKKYGGVFVPPHQAVIHQYMREMMAAPGKMILGSDSHTRYGALGCMGVGEGGPELVKQLLKKTWDAPRCSVVGVQLTGKPKFGVGPQDVALALIGATFKNGFVKNCVLEFFGDGIEGLSMDYRFGIDVMTTETTCLSSVWITDKKVKEYLEIHGRGEAYKEMLLEKVVAYDKLIQIDLSEIEPMIALPFHPSNTYTVAEVIANRKEIFDKVQRDAEERYKGAHLKYDSSTFLNDQGVLVQQGIIGGCSGGMYENIEFAASVLDGKSIGVDEFTLSVFPSSQPIYSALVKSGAVNTLFESGSLVKTAFCGPCFGAGDVPRNGGLSIRHNTRNFPNREGSKPGDGQLAAVALMDARSIAATAANGGILTPATELQPFVSDAIYEYNSKIYENRVYSGIMYPDNNVELILGPNIKDWPQMINLQDNLLMSAASVIHDEVTTTDELIPSGDTSSYRSNPLKLAEFTLSRKDPDYVPFAKKVFKWEEQRQNADDVNDSEFKTAITALGATDMNNTMIGSFIYANKPGDGSAREQAASCQKVLGGCANVALEYATKRYRSNCINWGMIPFTVKKELQLERGDMIYLEGIRKAIQNLDKSIIGKLYSNGKVSEIELYLKDITEPERDILLKGCLINYYKGKN
ncbi:MAG: hydratase [Clostridia bacterium]|nr:hydratase [Clostridia bacterium]